MILSRNLIYVLVTVMATACTPDAPPKYQEKSGQDNPQAAAASPTPVVTAVTSSNGMLTVDPAVIDLCKNPEGIIAADVKWNASSTGTESTEVWLESPGEGRKRWSGAGAIFETRTGTWLRDGSKVILINNGTKQELAQIQIVAKPCAI